MKEIAYSLFDTSRGPCGIAWRAAESEHSCPVIFLQLPDTAGTLTEKRIAGITGGRRSDLPPPYIVEITDRVRAHLKGKPQDFRDVAVDLEAMGSFTQLVLTACRNIPAGTTMSYGDLARVIHRPKAARAVGQALARNPVPLIIPCHRVLTRDGRAGGFSAPGGVETKKWILAKEGVTI